MWIYEKKLEYPVKITQPNPGLAKVIISQLGGPDGESGAATRYLQQRYTMPNGQIKGSLTDIGISCSKCAAARVFFLPGFPGKSGKMYDHL